MRSESRIAWIIVFALILLIALVLLFRFYNTDKNSDIPPWLAELKRDMANVEKLYDDAMKVRVEVNKTDDWEKQIQYIKQSIEKLREAMSIYEHAFEVFRQKQKDGEIPKDIRFPREIAVKIQQALRAFYPHRHPM